MTVHGQRVLVTGASGGLGPSICETFLAMGAHVVATARRRTALDDLRARLEHHDRLRVAECDVADAEGLSKLFDSLERPAGGSGPIDSVVHAVGTFVYGDISEARPEDIARLATTNFVSTAVVVREAMRRMTPRRAGTVAVVAADRALAPAPGFALYGATKAAVAHLVVAAALEGRAHGVRVNAVLPGTIDTPANREAMPDADRETWVSPRDVAGSLLWLSSPASGGVSGALVRLPAG